MRRNILWLCMMIVCFSAATAQISRWGIPPGFNYQPGNPEIPTLALPSIDLGRLYAEDQAHDTITGIPWRFGENIAVNLNPLKDGTWHTLSNGHRLWQLGISSRGAYSLNLTFDQYRLPPGAELYVYSHDRSVILGAFTEHNNQEDMHFATSPVPGDALIIEYVEPADAEFKGILNLKTVTHAYRDLFGRLKAFGSSGACNVNTACDEAIPWQNQVNASVMMIIDGNKACSGVLVNNSMYDATPFLLSANHCYGDASTLVVIFNWESETCVNPPGSPSYNSISGAVTRARHASSDFWLAELNQPIPGSYQPYFSGWNRTLQDSLDEYIFGIHHPRADIKKFSYTFSGVQSAGYIGNPSSGTTHWHIVWSGGTTTEPGSSGSALFDEMGRVIGQLHGGYAACWNTLPDWYGRFGISWSGGGTPETSLGGWLDPAGRNTMTLAGLDPGKLHILPPPDRALENINLTGAPFNCFDALFTITTGGPGGPFVTQPGAGANLIAGESIRMLAGTHFRAGSHVSASIAPVGPYCPNTDKQLPVAGMHDPDGELITSAENNKPDMAKVEPGKQSLFRVYPNPTPGQFTLELVNCDPSDEVSIEVYGMRGERIISGKLPGNLTQHQLSLEGHMPGLYFVRVISGQYVGVERIIKR